MLERSCFLVGGVSNQAGISYLSCTLAFSLSLFHCRFLNTYFQQQKCNFSKYILLATPCFHTSTSTQQFFPRYREAELAHGRVCMLATLGFSVQTSGAKFEPFITRNSDVLKISMFSLPGLLLFFDFLIFGSTCKFKWFTILLWCYWFKLQTPSTKSPAKGFFHGFSIISSQLGDLFSGYPTDSADPLKAATQACWKSNIGSNLLRNKHPDFFGEGFFGSRIFTFFWLAQNFETDSSEIRCFWWLIFFWFCMFFLWWDGKGEGSNEQCEEQCFQAFAAACHWVV